MSFTVLRGLAATALLALPLSASAAADSTRVLAPLPLATEANLLPSVNASPIAYEKDLQATATPLLRAA
ncbi:hypothetical protein [Streptomyces sp. NPDC017991]|uniref:hypothetical protein n=1 Tax=Streptomyces sp. NPDC017991 TaxID=3365026 RepID=UPI00378A5C79